MHCGDSLQSEIRCLYKKAKNADVTHIKRVRRKYLSYFKLRFMWKKGHLSNYRRVFHFCPKCLKSFIRRRILNCHIRSCWSDDGNEYGCETCDAMFISYVGLLGHVKEHGNVQNHMCAFCGHVLISLDALKRHQRWHRYSLIESDSENEKTLCNKSHLCVHCREEFNSAKSLAAHNKNNSCMEESPRCNVCGLHFSYVCQLKKHSNEHSELSKKFDLEIKRILRRWELRCSHGVTHCKVCGKSYKLQNNVVTKHIENHFRKQVEINSMEKQISYDLLLSNDSWRKAALLKDIIEVKPKVMQCPCRKEHKNPRAKKANNSKSEFGKSSINLKDLVNTSVKCQLVNGMHEEKSGTFTQDSTNSVIGSSYVSSNSDSEVFSFKDAVEEFMNICYSPNTNNFLKESGNDIFSSDNNVIESVCAKSLVISKIQKGSIVRMNATKCNSQEMARKISETESEEEDRKNDPLKCSKGIVRNNDSQSECYGMYNEIELSGSKSLSAVKSQNQKDGEGGEKECFQCPACHASFERGPFTLHVRQHEKENWYICHDCGLSFWCRRNLENHRLSNHRMEESRPKFHNPSNHPSQVKFVVHPDKMIKTAFEFKMLTDVATKGYQEKIFLCSSCGINFLRWEDFLIHMYDRNKNGLHCLETNTFYMTENEKSLLKRICEKYINERKFISKWRKYFRIDKEVNIVVESMVPCKNCREYYGTTEADHQTHLQKHHCNIKKNYVSGLHSASSK